MANQYPSGTAHHDLVNRSRVSNTKKQPNWLHSIIAGAAMLAIGSVGVVLVFDWYFFSVMDALSTSLRPIASVLRHANAAKAITDKSDQPRDGDQAGSLFVPVRSAADSKTPAN